MTIKGKITKGSINVDGKELNFNEFVEHEARNFKDKYENIEDRLRDRFFLFDILFSPFKRILGILFIISLNVSLFMFFMILETPDWAKIIMTYLILSNLIPYLMKKDKR